MRQPSSICGLAAKLKMPGANERMVATTTVQVHFNLPRFYDDTPRQTSPPLVKPVEVAKRGAPIAKTLAENS